MYRKTVAFCMLLILTPAAALADLTGVWNANDGGKYYLRQTANLLYWYGEPSAASPRWSNVFYGTISGARVNGHWVDVPKGQVMSQGIMKLEIRENGNVLVARQKTGGFGGSRWTREGYIPPAPPPAPSALNEDCIGFNPDTAQVKNISGRWKIVDGSHGLFDFNNSEAEARQAMRVIRRYHANQSCFVGRPNPAFSYLKSGNHAPTGPLAGEDCIGFNPGTIQAKNVNGRWKLADGSHWVFDFGAKQQDALKALQVIKHYGFTKSCYVGRPNPSLKYLRK